MEERGVTKIDLRRLPLLAIVALACRSAMRMRSRLRLPPGGDTAARLEAIDAAIGASREVAMGQRVGSDLMALSQAASAAAGPGPPAVVGIPLSAPANAAHAARVALRGDPRVAVIKANLCLPAAGPALAVTEQDYVTLVQLRLGKFPGRGKPVDVSATGPLGLLWPDD